MRRLLFIVTGFMLVARVEAQYKSPADEERERKQQERTFQRTREHFIEDQLQRDPRTYYEENIENRFVVVSNRLVVCEHVAGTIVQIPDEKRIILVRDEERIGLGGEWKPFCITLDSTTNCCIALDIRTRNGKYVKPPAILVEGYRVYFLAFESGSYRGTDRETGKYGKMKEYTAIKWERDTDRVIPSEHVVTFEQFTNLWKRGEWKPPK